MSNMPNAMEQPVPPSVREILTAYSAKGSDADRDVLLAILQAKAAEDQRITALASLNQQYIVLQRQALEATTIALQHQHLTAAAKPSRSSTATSASSSPLTHSSHALSPRTAAFPPSPYSLASARPQSSGSGSGRSPSPSVSVSSTSITAAHKRKHREEDELASSDRNGNRGVADRDHHAPVRYQRRRSGEQQVQPGKLSRVVPPPRAPTQSQLQSLGQASVQLPAITTLPLSPSSSTSSSNRPRAPSVTMRDEEEERKPTVLPPSPGSSNGARRDRRMDISSVLSTSSSSPPPPRMIMTGPPISALRGGSDRDDDE